MIYLNNNQKELTTDYYPNGELIWNHQTNFEVAHAVRFHWETDDDWMQLYFLTQEVDPSSTELRIDYLPYSRMDRAGAAKDDYQADKFSLKYISKFINGLGYKYVRLTEPHSDVSMALIDNSYAVFTSIRLLEKVQKQQNSDYIVFPDAGAEKRYADRRRWQLPILVGSKHRDFSTGEILSFDIANKSQYSDYEGKSAVIVDDLCSRGGTFKATAKVLKDDLGFARVDLVVTHLENVFSILSMEGLIDSVTATNSIWNKGSTALFGCKLNIVDLNEVNYA